MQYIYRYLSPLGSMTMAGETQFLTGLWFDGQKYYGSTLQCCHEEGLLPIFEETVRWLDCYFSGVKPDFTPSIKLYGTSFQQMVWHILQSIPYGSTMTYGEIAHRIAAFKARPAMSSQAVGGAVGHNPISIIVPCHRVLGHDGRLTGYAGGLDKKLRLLSLEHIL